MSRASEFLARHGMLPQDIDPAHCAGEMLKQMKLGLERDGMQLPMIPTYLKNDGQVPKNSPVVVIDAGGTNFRRALVSFTDEGVLVEELEKKPMPGIKAPVSWEEFISFVADAIMPIIHRSDRIGFCFSYNAKVTPEIDCRVVSIDKEVVVHGCEGKLVGASLVEELERRGVKGKRAVILNDTVAVLLGGSATVNKADYSGFIGQVSGTGTNTCCAVPYNKIGKLCTDSDEAILVNLEAGMYAGIPRGEFDIALDEGSNVPGNKLFEKLTAGVYLGELCRIMLTAAASEGLLSAECAEKVRALGRIDASYVDAWSVGEELDKLRCNAEDAEFVRELSTALFERSARCMCTNLLAIMQLTGEGTDPEKPVAVCAEGSLVQRSRLYSPMLREFLREYAARQCGCHAELIITSDSTLPGSAAAALLNC